MLNKNILKAIHTETNEKASEWFMIALSAKTRQGVTDKITDLIEWLTADKNRANLKDISFTLLTGRNHYLYRTAYVVCSIEDLIDKLKSSLEDTQQIAEASGIDNRKAEEKEISEGDMGILSVSQDWLTALKNKYLAGENYPFADLFENKKVSKIPLPSYPFAREKYWVPETKAPAAMKKKLHPLLEEDFGTSYRKTFTGREFYLEDHKVGQDKVLPGVAYVEMVRAAGEIYLGESISCIRNVAWHSAIKFLPLQNKQLTINIIFENREDKLWYKVVSGEGDNLTLHSEGILEKQKNLEPLPRNISFRDFIKNADTSVSGADCYARLRQRGLNLGKCFQAIKTLYLGEDYVFSELEAPDGITGEYNSFLLHPSMLDGALETTVYLVKNQSDVMSLPSGVDQVRVYAPIPKRCFAYTTLSKNEQNALEEKKYDVQIMDEDGKVVADVKGFTLRLLNSTPVKAEDNILKEYLPVWEERNLSAEGKAVPQRKYLLFKNEQNEFITGDFNSEDVVVTVRKGKAFQKASRLEYQIDPDSSRDYQTLLEDLMKENLLPEVCLFEYFPEKEIKAYGEAIYPLYHLLHNLTPLLNGSVKVYYLYPLKARQECLPIGAFLKSVNMEHNNITGKCIGIDEPARWSELLLKESRDAAFSETDVVYEKHNRYVKVLKESIAENSTDKGSFITKADTVLITGGQGGIGKLLTDTLIKTAGKVILIGRGELTADTKAAFERWNKDSQGESCVIYRQCDVSEYEEVRNLKDWMLHNTGKADVILHLAGTIADSYIEHKTLEQLETVLRPKIRGLRNIEEIFGTEPLKSLVIFSSIAAVCGNAGQSDYAYANAYMDEFIREHAGKNKIKKMLSINWPFWEKGGMKLTESTKQLYERAKGVSSIEADMAFHIMNRALFTDQQQLLPVCGNPSKFEKLLGLLKSPAKFEEENQNKKIKIADTKIDDRELDDTELNNKLFKEIAKDISQVLQVKEENILITDDFGRFGFNSLTFTDISNLLNETYGIDVIPSVFFEYQTINSFLEYMLKNYKEELLNYYAGEEISKGEIPGENSYESLKEETDSSADEGIWEAPQVAAAKEAAEPITCNTEERETEAAPKDDDIAIIGMYGQMPQSENLEEFWNNLAETKDLITEVPKDRWNWEEIYSADGSEENKTYAKWGGFMREIDKFDNKFFSVSPKEAELMDPQQRLFMETVYHTLEDAGYTPKTMEKYKTGLFVGVSTIDYYDLMKDANVPLEAQLSTGISHCVLANRISYQFNFTGPSEPVDTACSSSLVAIHRAIQAIKEEDCEVAIAGGVNILASPMLFITFAKAGMLSKTGRCHTFDKTADGYVRGEGSGAILLKPLKAARRDKDHIYGVIKASAVNHGGKVNSLTSPNPTAQKELLKKAYHKAKIDPSTITYVEAHGTGTKLGDPIEINALKDAFNELYHEKGIAVQNNRCGIGSVKTNIGHLETASGIAGLLKILLAMKYKKIPGNVSLKDINPYILLENSPFYIPKETKDWEALTDRTGQELPRRAGISSFGFGGANAHLVLEEYTEGTADNKSYRKRNFGKQLILVSAKNENALQKNAAALFHYLQSYQNNTAAFTFMELKNILGEVLNLPIGCLREDEKLIDLGLEPIKYEILKEKLYEITKEPIVEEPGQAGELSLQQFYNRIKKNTRSKEGPNLDSFAYTLQTGREHMEYRLGFAVSTLGELSKSLEGYLTREKESEEDYFRIVKANRAIINYSPKEDENIESILNRWLGGENIVWEELYQEEPPRISLPVYSFERVRHWFKPVSVKNPLGITADFEADKANKPEVHTPQENLPQEKRVPLRTEQKTASVIHAAKSDKVSMDILYNHIALVTMKDIENRNMFTEELVQGLLYQFQEINNSTDIKVAIVTGSNGIFSMGGTKDQLEGIAEKENKFTDIPFLYEGLLTANIPVIAAIQGHASGGGFLFGLYADIVIASKQGSYSASFMKYGFTPGMGATYILKEKLGSNTANEMMFSANSFGGDELKERGAGILFREQQEVLKEALKIASALSKKPKYALQVLKQELSSRALDSLYQVLDKEVKMHELTFASESVKEKIKYYYHSEENISKTSEPDKSETGKSIIVNAEMLKNRQSRAQAESITKKDELDDLLTQIENGLMKPEEALERTFILN